MKKRIILLLMVCVFFVGCANQQLDTLKDIDAQNRKGLVEAYDEALYRTKVERLDLENQFIDLQSDYDLVVKAYVEITGEPFDKVSEIPFLSLDELEEHKVVVEKDRELRRVEILKSYAEFYKQISRAKDPKLMEAIDKIEKERTETETGFLSGFFDVFKKLFS